MSRYVVHMAVHAEKRAAAATMDGLEGGEANFSVPLQAIGGDAATWGALKGYGTAGYGARLSVAEEVGQQMLASGYEGQTEVFFAIYFENTLEPVPSGCNLSAWPAGPTFEEFLAGAGWNDIRPKVAV